MTAKCLYHRKNLFMFISFGSQVYMLNYVSMIIIFEDIYILLFLPYWSWYTPAELDDEHGIFNTGLVKRWQSDIIIYFKCWLVMSCRTRNAQDGRQAVSLFAFNYSLWDPAISCKIKVRASCSLMRYLLSVCFRYQGNRFHLLTLWQWTIPMDILKFILQIIPRNQQYPFWKYPTLNK